MQTQSGSSSVPSWWTDFTGGFSDFFNRIGNGLSDIGSSLGGFFDTARSFFISIGNKVTDGLTGLGDRIRGFFDDLKTSVVDITDRLRGFFSSMVDWINPISNNFILKVALVPSQDFLSDKVQTFNGIVKSRLSWVTTISDAVKTIRLSDSTGGVDSIKATIPVINKEVTVVNFQYLNEHASFVRGLGSAFLYLLLVIYLLRIAPSIFGYMH